MANKTKKSKVFATHVTTPDGRRVYVKGKTKEELDRKVFDLKMQVRAGVDIKSDVTFADYAPVWLKAYKQGKIRESSYALLETNLRLHVLPFFGGMKLKEIKPMHIQLYLTEISSYSKSLQTKCLQTVKAILRAAADNGLIVRSPVRQEDKVSAAEPPEEQPLTDEQVLRLLDAVKGTKAYTFCLVALSTGMRRGEILGLMWEDVDFENRVIHVRHNKAFVSNKQDAPVTEMLKTEAARRDLPMSLQLSTHLQSVRNRSPYVFCQENGKSLTKSGFRAMWGTVTRRTVGKRELGGGYGTMKVTLDFSCHPHQLRHTYITKLFEEGLDVKQVQYLAGHSTPEMTLRVYTHYRAAQRSAQTHEQVCGALRYLAGEERRVVIR